MLQTFLALALVSCAAPAPSSIPIGDITAEALEPVQAKFDELAAQGDKEISFTIDSLGGSIFAGEDFLKHVEASKRANGIHVTCYVDMMAASMGFVLLQDICDQRLMTKRSILLAHNSSAQYQGNVQTVENDLDLSRALDFSLSEIIGERLNIGPEAYRAEIAHGDWSMNYPEALRVGAVDGTVEVKDLPVTYEIAKVDPLSALRKLLAP